MHWQLLQLVASPLHYCTPNILSSLLVYISWHSGGKCVGLDSRYRVTDSSRALAPASHIPENPWIPSNLGLLVTPLSHVICIPPLPLFTLEQGAKLLGLRDSVFSPLNGDNSLLAGLFWDSYQILDVNVLCKLWDTTQEWCAITVQRPCGLWCPGPRTTCFLLKSSGNPFFCWVLHKVGGGCGGFPWPWAWPLEYSSHPPGLPKLSSISIPT